MENAITTGGMRRRELLRVYKHPILGQLEERKKVRIKVDDSYVEAFEGEPILAALLAAGIRVNGITKKEHKPRGLFCGIGRCTDCVMIVDGVPNVRTCVTPVADGMVVQTQEGLGKWGNAK